MIDRSPRLQLQFSKPLRLITAITLMPLSAVEFVYGQEPAAISAQFSEDFANYRKNECFRDGESFGEWTSAFGGYGCNSIISAGDSQALSLRPRPAASSGETHGALVLGPRFSSNMTFNSSMRTVSQLRTGSPPAAWEVGWVLWSYTDGTHFYYFIPKPNGWELGKEDPSYPGSQRFLASGSSPAFPVGSWHNISVGIAGRTISVSVNGALVTAYTDSQNPYLGGQIGLYCEDAQVYFKGISVTSP
ncbi:MAG: family 16 glycoside hydrolase [Rhodomicrobium sp.]